MKKIALVTGAGTGIGRALIVEAERRLAEHHAEATLWVLVGNVRAQRFYEAAGWHPDGGAQRDRVWGVAVTEVRYRKRVIASSLT